MTPQLLLFKVRKTVVTNALPPSLTFFPFGRNFVSTVLTHFLIPVHRRLSLNIQQFAWFSLKSAEFGKNSLLTIVADACPSVQPTSIIWPWLCDLYRPNAKAKTDESKCKRVFPGDLNNWPCSRQK